MHVLWLSNYTTTSAYALQSRMIVPRFKELGHRVTVLDIRNGGGQSVQIGDITVLPTFLDAIGNDSIQAHFERSKADVVISLVDAWGLSPDSMKNVPWWPITPIDHTPVPPAVVNSLKAADGVIALSRFGQAELRKVGVDSLYMPHALDPKVWYPALTQEQMGEARQRLRISNDAFLVSFVGVNDSNPSRKGIPELLAAWSMFQPSHRDALLYLHTTPQGNIPVAGSRNGVDIDTILTTFGIDPKSILMPDQYRLRTGIPATELANVARASNVFVLPSRGEGFGVPLIEFQHAGTPVITTDFAAGAELCASGWLLDGEAEWDWQNATVIKPGIASIVERFEQAYSERGNDAYRQQAAEFARDFELDYVFSKFVAPCLETIAERIILAQRVVA